jgi:hypothetical protein
LFPGPTQLSLLVSVKVVTSGGDVPERCWTTLGEVVSIAQLSVIEIVVARVLSHRERRGTASVAAPWCVRLDAALAVGDDAKA